MEHTGKYLVAAAVFSYVVNFTSAVAVTATPCTGGGSECSGIAHSSCDTTLGSPMCKCDATYKQGTGSSDNTCVEQAVSEITCASGGTECSVVTNSACDGSKCQCNSAYKEGSGTAVNTCVAKGLGDPCDTANTNADCAAVTNAVCIAVSGTDKCACTGQYKESGGQCVQKGYGESCSGNGDCAGDTNSECSTTCVCKADFTAINNVCRRGLGNTCANTGECSAVANSECTGTPMKCACEADYTAINSLCQRGLNNTCTNDASCSAVDNAECPAGTLKCTCKANYKEDNGQCSSSKGSQTLLSAPVALLLSFLTIVVTTLH